MTPRWQRAIANALCDILHIILPEKLAQWADILRAEIVNINHDGDAMQFALGGFCGLLPPALFAHGQALFNAITNNRYSSGDMSAMGSSFHIFHRPRVMGIICAIIAVISGMAYMTAAGAPSALPALNLGALFIGLAALALFVHVPPITGRWAGIGIITMAAILLITAQFGSAVEGAKRWLLIGPFFIQTSLLFLPVMVVHFARTRNAVTTIGMIIAALAFALQPDRAMAGALLASLIGCTLYRFDRFTGIALLTAVIAFSVTLMKADTLPAVPYVDKVLYTAFDIHLFAGIAIAFGSIILLAPAIIGLMRNNEEPLPYAVFGLVWLSVIAAAAIGNYPTPLVGYGSSAIIGYLLSLCALPKYALAAPRSNTDYGEAKGDRQPPALRQVTSLSVAGP